MGVVTCGVATQLCGYDVATSHVVTPTLGIITRNRAYISNEAGISEQTYSQAIMWQIY